MGYEGFYTEEKINLILSLMVERRASDLYLVVGIPPTLKEKGGALKQLLDYPTLNPSDTEDIVCCLGKDRMDKIMGKEEGDIDLSYELSGKARFRINITHSFSHYGLVIRRIPLEIPRIEDLGLSPEVTERLKKICNYKDGLVLVTGPTGCGKSTTLAAMIKEMMMKKVVSLVTIEDPIEFVHRPIPDRCDVVIQQEVGIDTPSFYEGLRTVLRKRPNVILVGEIRSTKEMEEAIVAGNTGHLVLGTLHTRSAAQTIDRIVALRHGVAKEYAYKEVAEVSRCFIAQQLIPRANGEGWLPVCEILANTPYVADIITKGADFMELKGALEGKTRSEEIISLNTDLFNRWQRGEIKQEDALALSYDPTDFDLKVRRLGFKKEERKDEEKGFLFKDVK
ncbi:MAG: ATPase, T2SS/T4P/T4SS family [Candidatus Desantisbacteria bacterium]